MDKNPYPRVNGLEMVERLLEGKQDIRVILMSSSAGSELRSRGLVRDDLPFLKKPFTTEALLALVQQVLAGPPAVAAPKKSTPAQKDDVEWFD